jgi:hypothetical protein
VVLGPYVKRLENYKSTSRLNLAVRPELKNIEQNTVVNDYSYEVILSKPFQY